MEADEIVRLIKEALPDAAVEIDDLREDGDHYDVRVTSAAFAGRDRLEQHRMVFAALQGRVGGVIRAFSLTTNVPRGAGRAG